MGVFTLYMLNKLIFVLLTAISMSSLASVAKFWIGTNLSDSKPITVSVESPGKRGLVVVFLSTKCPCSSSHILELKDLAKKFDQFRFVGIHSNSDESPELAKVFFSALELPFPVIQDEKAKIADELKAFKTPHAYVFGPQGEVLYRGGVTNSANGPTADEHYLADALAELSAGRPVKVSDTRTLGCVIARENDNKNVW